MKKMFFIYNPNAGMGQLKSKVSDVIDVFVKHNYEVTVYPTQQAGDGTKKIEELPDGYDLIVCSGGDGTLDEIVTGMARREKKVPIGYIPTGTANDFATSLGIPKQFTEAAALAVTGEAKAFDIGRFNEDYFVYIAAFGIFTDVSYETKQEMKNILGHIAYVLEGAKRIFNVPSYHLKITYEEGVIEDEFVFGMVTNSRSVGGFASVIGPDIVFDDGVFEVTLIKTPKTPIDLNEILGALILKQIDNKHMYSFKTGKMKVECDSPFPWTLDGEYGGDHSVVEIENLQRYMKIVTDKNMDPELIENDQEKDPEEIGEGGAECACDN